MVESYLSCLSQLWRADDTFSLLIVDVSLFQEPGLYSAVGTRNFVVAGPRSCVEQFASEHSLCVRFSAELKTYLFQLP